MLFKASASLAVNKSGIREFFQIPYQRWLKEKIFYRKAQDDFYRLFGGHILFQALYAGVEFDLFNLLAKRKRMTLSQIAQHLEIEEQPCRILLLSLVVAKVVKRRGDRFSNTRMARIFLTDNGEWKFSDCVRWQHHINYRALFWFYEALKDNSNIGLKEFSGDEATLYQRLSHEPFLENVFQNAMQELSQQSNPQLSFALDFSSVTKLLDVGGGNGTNLIRLAGEYPDLTGAIFDFPSVCDIAKSNFEKNSFANRLDAISGNIFQDELPRGFDCITFCHFFTIWSKEENLVLLRKAYEALPESGRVVVFNMMQNDNEKGPITAAVGSPYFLTLATGRGMLYTWSEYENLMRQAGFSTVTRKKLCRDHGVIVGTK